MFTEPLTHISLSLTDPTEDYIKEASGEVLGLFAGNEAFLTPEDVKENDGQIWIRGEEDSNGWFTLSNVANKKLLTSKSEVSLTTQGEN